MSREGTRELVRGGSSRRRPTRDWLPQVSTANRHTILSSMNHFSVRSLHLTLQIWTKTMEVRALRKVNLIECFMLTAGVNKIYSLPQLQVQPELCAREREMEDLSRALRQAYSGDNNGIKISLLIYGYELDRSCKSSETQGSTREGKRITSYTAKA